MWGEGGEGIEKFHSFIHLFIWQIFIESYCVPGSLLGAGLKGTDRIPHSFICFVLFWFFWFFLFFWLHWVFVAARGLSLVAASGGYSSLQCTDFSVQWLLLLRSTGCRRMGFSSCGMQPQ